WSGSPQAPYSIVRTSFGISDQTSNKVSKRIPRFNGQDRSRLPSGQLLLLLTVIYKAQVSAASQIFGIVSEDFLELNLSRIQISEIEQSCTPEVVSLRESRPDSRRLLALLGHSRKLLHLE